MPGIVGLFSKSIADTQSMNLQGILHRLIHEPFYNSGIYTNESVGVCVGWVALANTFCDDMPVWNETKDVCLVFSGEDYRDREEINRLSYKGHLFRKDDASYLVHIYEELGSEWFEKINGRFSGVLIDLRLRECTLFNDRYGFGRIYYHEDSSGLMFASEAKALLWARPALRSLSERGLGEYFALGCPLENRTLFCGISLLPPATAWRFSPAEGMRMRTYFNSTQWQQQGTLSPSDYYVGLREVWKRILPRYFFGAQPIGVSLTGGKDSRMIMAWTRKPYGSLPCYTFSSMYHESEDVRIGRRVAAACGQPHRIIEVGASFISEFPELARQTVYLTDGAMDVSGTPDLFANRIARQIAPVRMTGNYGQEILRSELAFKPLHLRTDIFDAHFVRSLQAGVEVYYSILESSRNTFILSCQMPWYHYSRLCLELSQITVRSPYTDNDLVATAFRTPPELIGSIEPQLRLIVEGNTNVALIGTDRGKLLSGSGLINAIRSLVKQFTFKAEYAYDYGMPQLLCRFDRTLRCFRVERLFIGRHKFYHFRVWYRDQLSSYIREMLLDPRSLSRAYLNRGPVEKMVMNHTKGNENYTLEIHRLLSMEILQRELIDF